LFKKQIVNFYGKSLPFSGSKIRSSANCLQLYRKYHG